MQENNFKQQLAELMLLKLIYCFSNESEVFWSIFQTYSSFSQKLKLFEVIKSGSISASKHLSTVCRKTDQVCLSKICFYHKKAQLIVFMLYNACGNEFLYVRQLNVSQQCLWYVCHQWIIMTYLHIDCVCISHTSYPSQFELSYTSIS